jgi:hypothetical protein
MDLENRSSAVCLGFGPVAVLDEHCRGHGHASGTASCFRHRFMLAGSAWDPSQLNAAQAKRPQLMG